MPPGSDSKTTTPGRDPMNKMYTLSTWKGKGRHRSTPHSDHSGKCGTAWSRAEVIAIYPACDLFTREEIKINILGQTACPECGYIASYDSSGRLACNCTVWNEGTPRPIREPDPSADAIMEQARQTQIRLRQLRKFAKGGRC
jgi:hypothetical protein